MKKSSYWLMLSKVKGIGNKTLLKIYSRNKEIGINIEEFWNLEGYRISKQYAIRNSIIEEIIRNRKNNGDFNALQEELDSKRVKVLTLEDEIYPSQLKEIDKPPFILYTYGNLNLLNKNPVAIVGSRDISNEGLALTYKLTDLLLKQDITVLKGDTKEIDTITHIATRNTEGFEITVLSEGILINLYKLEKKKKQIDMSKILILSFVDPNLRWTPRGERKRNQIVFSLSDKIIVVEARKGGIIIQESIKAVRKGKSLFVVRYEKYPQNAFANKFLIEKGAKPISSIATTQNLMDIIESVNDAIVIEKTGQKKDLGQYFTPQTVVKFMYNIITTMWQKEKPRIIDPACGEGIFLKYALEQGITDGDNLYGCDIDKSVREKWDAFGFSNKMKLLIHNGLLDSEELGIERAQFDLVIGNPPYGGTGLGELVQLLKDKHKSSRVSALNLFEKESEFKKKELVVENKKIYSAPISKERKRELIQLANALGEFYEIWKKGNGTESTDTEEQEPMTSNLFEDLAGIKSGKKRVDLIVERIQKSKLLGKGKEQLHLSSKELKKLISYPIEILFIERFLQLAKPGGYIAIIIPDGILANINLQYVREWIFNKARVFAVVSLPRETFKYIGTTAKTSIIFMQKFTKEQTYEYVKNLPIFMASADYVGTNNDGKNDLPTILKEFKKFQRREKIKEGHRSPILSSTTGEDVLKVHRLDPEYWNPKYTKVIKAMKKRWKVNKIEDYKISITAGDHIRALKKEKYTDNINAPLYLKSSMIKFSGLSYPEVKRITENAYQRLIKSQVHQNDIVIATSGSIGKTFILTKKIGRACTCDLYILRVKELNPYFIAVYLKSKFGRLQMERFEKGVAITHITVDHIESIQIPILPQSIQKEIEREYKKMSKWHDKAMEAKKELIDSGMSNKEAEKDVKYKRNIKKAEALLEDLIKKTEEIIESKRKKL